MSVWQVDQLHIVDLVGQEVTQESREDQGQENTEGVIEDQEGNLFVC